jgi:hypothetical protein
MLSKEQNKQMIEVIGKLDDYISACEELQGEFSQKYDDLKPKDQNSDKGENLQHIISTLDNASSFLDNARSELEGIVERN